MLHNLFVLNIIVLTFPVLLSRRWPITSCLTTGSCASPVSHVRPSTLLHTFLSRRSDLLNETCSTTARLGRVTSPLRRNPGARWLVLFRGSGTRRPKGTTHLILHGLPISVRGNPLLALTLSLFATPPDHPIPFAASHGFRDDAPLGGRGAGAGKGRAFDWLLQCQAEGPLHLIRP